MHRSGTTLLSQLFNQAGVFQGVFRDHNSEAFHFLSINQQVLSKSSNDWLDPIEPNKVNWYSISAEELYAIHFQVRRSPQLKWLNNHRWGWKDPRNTFTLPMYLKLFPKARVIHVIRNGIDVALSLQQRNTVHGEVLEERLNDLAFNFNLWQTYVEKGNSYRQEINRFVEVRYEDLLEKNLEVIERVSAWGGIDLKPYLGSLRAASKNYYPQALIDLSEKSKAFKKWYGG